jgi:transposase-like protein
VAYFRGETTLAEHTTISVCELFTMIPDAEAARLYLEGRLWPNGPTCPVCGKGERITTRKDGFYRCNACREDFTVRTGTIFERSHIPLNKWIYAMYLMVTARKGISSLQLAKEIGVTQKSAWFRHDSINHTRGQYRRGNVTTNGIESVFAVLKRGILGVFHQVSVKHLGRYVQEFSFRLNEGNTARKTVERLDSFIDGVARKRLTYERLIA